MIPNKKENSVNRLTPILISLIISCFVVANSQAATDYNSSRSNKADSSRAAAEDLNNLLSKATADVRRISKEIISIEADGSDDTEMLVTVTVKVQVCKVAKECLINQEAEPVTCQCTHL
jgi:hypothetical protein